MDMTKTEYVCLHPAGVVEGHRTALRERGIYGSIKEYWWRRIRATATADGVKLELMNVDEEAARGGYWNGGTGSLRHTFAWNDLDDVDNLKTLLMREQLIV